MSKIQSCLEPSHSVFNSIQASKTCCGKCTYSIHSLFKCFTIKKRYISLWQHIKYTLYFAHFIYSLYTFYTLCALFLSTFTHIFCPLSLHFMPFLRKCYTRSRVGISLNFTHKFCAFYAQCRLQIDPLILANFWMNVA